MGNWRTVHIAGHCNADEAEVLREYVNDLQQWGPLHNGGICGLHEWPAEVIDVTGNLGERGYSVEDVAATLRKLIEIAPSLRVRIDCGADDESLDCVATIVTDEDGTVGVLPPAVETLPAISEGHMAAGFFDQLANPRYRR